MSKDIPCKSCPWRVDNDATDIPGYNHNKACSLMSTVGSYDSFRSIMQCHSSTDENPTACLGYVARDGWSNLSIRVAVISGRIPSPSEIDDACENAGISLEPDYETVLAKLSESVDEDQYNA